MKLVECVPNFSEGRRAEVVEELANALTHEKGATLLDKEMDADHHRCVLTVAGEPHAVVDGIFRAMQLASLRIDLTTHQGAHPRIGATDVVPFIPLQEMSLEECVGLARQLGQMAGDVLGIPIYMYGDAALRPERRDLPNLRKGQFEGLRERIGPDRAWDPDFGPAKIHPTAGATAVGVRFFLIAYNINLATAKVEVAKGIAKQIREASGGFPKVKALGFELKERQLAQVSMNLTDFRVTSILTIYRAVEQRAREAGVEVVESELVGLVPQAAISDAVVKEIKLKGFSPSQIIEERLKQEGMTIA